MTGSSTLDPDNFPGKRDTKLGTGHKTSDLGPSDLSDTGSDTVGGPGFAQQEMLDLGRGTTSDVELSTARGTAGPDVGDADLDSDSDYGGTGERAEAGRDLVGRAGADIDVDHVEDVSIPLDDEDVDFLASNPPGQGRAPHQAPRGK